MPPGLFSKTMKQSKQAKQRLEHLMVVAKENPDKIFDLNSCELSQVPQPVFEECRVFLMKSLILHTNYLKKLDGKHLGDLCHLQILDLHGNQLKSLPDNLGALKNLQVLNVENNQLTELPLSVGNLGNLQSLLARDNDLNSLPDSIQGMKSLRVLDVGGRNKIYYLPKTLCRIVTLEALVLAKPHLMEYPPAYVCQEGVVAIQKYICKDCGVRYVPPSLGASKVLQNGNSSQQSSLSHQPGYDYSTEHDVTIDQNLKLQDIKAKQQLEMERQFVESQQAEVDRVVKVLHDNAKTQVYVKEEFDKFEKEMLTEQQKKEKQHQDMIKELQRAEKSATSLITKVLDVNEKAKKTEALMKEMEQQRLEEEEYFRITQEEIDALRKQETLAAMEIILAENAQYSVMIQQYLGDRSHAIKLAQKSLDKDDNQVQQELTRTKNRQGDLVNQILQEEQLQREAFIALQMQQDAVQIRLRWQIVELENELLKLSLIEMERNKIKVQEDRQNLCAMRTELCDVLMVLLKQKDAREEELRSRLVEMENQKQDDQIDFWLVQYQRLLDSKPEILVQKEHGLDRDVMYVLRQADAEHHASAFARHRVNTDNISTLDEQRLRTIGVFEMGLVANILREVENLVAQRKKVDAPRDEEPSSSAPAPVQTPARPSPSAPDVPRKEMSSDAPEEHECVVCLDEQCDCVFLPCGHVCSCYICATSLNECPMCRAQIQQKIRIFRS